MRLLQDHMWYIFVIKLEGKKEDKEYAKLSLVDLAGSERATETQSNDKSRLAQGAEINKYLLAFFGIKGMHKNFRCKKK